MALRLSRGEYESTEEPTLESTHNARAYFFSRLETIKPECLFDLLALYDANITTEVIEMLGKPQIDALLFLHLRSDKRLKKPKPTNVMDTPVNHLTEFFCGKERKLERLIRKLSAADTTYQSIPTSRYVKEAISQILPNWDKLTSIASASKLRSSIQRWGQKWNLNDTWCLDFAVGILREFKFHFDSYPRDFFTDKNLVQIYYEYESICGNAIRGARQNRRSERIWALVNDMNNFPPFEYKFRDFRFHKTSWFPRHEWRKDYVEEVKADLGQTIKRIKQFAETFEYSDGEALQFALQEEKKNIERYCNFVLKEKNEYSGLTPNWYRFSLGESDFSASWDPTSEDREHFVNRTIEELKTQIVKNNKIVKDLAYFTKTAFNQALREYCNSIVKMIPKEWIMSPRKYSEEKHFDWLIQYQLESNTFFSDIAKNKANVKTVREAIEGLADILKLTLKERKKSGRPKGVKDSDESIRKLKLFRR